MHTVSDTLTFDQLTQILDRVEDDQEAVLITRDGQAVAVLMSIAEYNSLQEVGRRLPIQSGLNPN